MRRNLLVTALVAVIMGGFVLAYLSLSPTGSRGQMGGGESASQTAGMGEKMRGDGAMGDMAAPGDVPRVPPVKGYAEGEQIFSVHTEASDREIARKLTGMMGSPVLVVPSLAEVPAESLANVCVFANGVKVEGPRGPLGFQPDVFDVPPGTDGYSPLRALNKVTWKDEEQACVLKSAAEVREAEENGEMKIERPGVVVNMPFLTWPGGKR